MRSAFFPLLTALLLVAPACDNGDDEGSADPNRKSAIRALQGDATNGETLYQEQCAACHAANGSGGSGPRISGQGLDQTINAMLVGPDEMPTYDHFEDQELADIAQYVAEL